MSVVKAIERLGTGSGRTKANITVRSFRPSLSASPHRPSSRNTLDMLTRGPVIRSFLSDRVMR